MSVTLKNVLNTQFTGKLSIGKPPQEFDLIFDSGSQNLIVNSLKCKDPGCQIADQYICESSSTCVETSLIEDFYFGSGSINAQLTADTVCIDKVCIDDTPFFQIVEEDGEVFDTGSFDGIVGLGISLKTDESPSFLDYLVLKNALFQNVFSVYLSDDEDSFSSQLILGGVDTRFSIEQITYHPVVDNEYWTIKIDKILLGPNDTNLCSEEQKCVGIIDTGTSMMTGPESSLRDFLDFFNKNVENGQDCSLLETYPDLIFVINGKQYPISATEYILSIDLTGNEYMYDHPEPNNILSCAATFSPLNIEKFEKDDIHAWILGDIFISKYYTIFDRQNNQIGFGKSIN